MPKAKKSQAEAKPSAYVVHYSTMDQPPAVMAIGTVIPKMTPNAMDYLDDVRDFNTKRNQTVKDQIELCRKLYTYDGILATAIDILTEFPTTKFYLENVKDKQCEKILNYFIEEVNKDNPNTLKGLNHVSRQLAHGFFVDGNTFPYETWATVTDPYNKKIKNRKMPVKITMLNPLSLTIPKEFVEFGYKRIFMKVSDDLIDIIRKKHPTQLEQELISFIPPSILEQARQQENWDGMVMLENEYVTHIKRKGQDYEVWGVPYLARVFSVAASKQRLRTLDDATTTGLVNFITIFKIGDPANPKTWSQARLTAFANMLRNPAASNTMVWSYDIDYITVGPKGDVLSFNDKYKQVNYDMLAALGIPEILFTGQGSQAGVWTAVLSMLERLEKFREDIKIYYEDLLRKICIANGFEREFPRIRWARMRLRDERAAKNIVMALHDRGILPFRTTLNELDYDYEVLRTLREEENERGDDKVFTRRDNMPFSGDSEKPDVKEPNTTTEEGRPPGNKDVFVKSVEQLVLKRADNALKSISSKYENEEHVDKVELSNALAYASIQIDHDISNAINAVGEHGEFISNDVDYERESIGIKAFMSDAIAQARNEAIAAAYTLFDLTDTDEDFLDKFTNTVDNFKAEIRNAVDKFHAFVLSVSQPQGGDNAKR